MIRFRLYSPDECGADGYPFIWHKGEPAIKDSVRELAGHRCIRCGHPYRKGEHGNGEWSPCDLGCDHAGPFRGWAGGRVAWVDAEAASRQRAQFYLVDEGVST